MKNGFVAFHKKIVDWEWYQDGNTARLFFHLIIKANYSNVNWEGITIKRGQIVTSVNHLSRELNLSPMQIRTSLVKLEKTQNITCKTTNKYTIITVENYDKFQSKKEKATNNITNEQQTDNKRITTIEQYNNNNKKNNINNTCPDCEMKFSIFWNAYPKKVAKKKALESFKKIQPDNELMKVILKAIEEQKQTEQWRKDAGKYIPMPVTWLNQERWNDEIAQPSQKELKGAAAIKSLYAKYQKEEELEENRNGGIDSVPARSLSEPEKLFS